MIKGPRRRHLRVTAPASSTTAASSATSGATTITQPASPSPSDAVSKSPSDAAQVLAGIYSAYEADPTHFSGDTLTVSGARLVVIDGTNVGIQVHDGQLAGDFSTLLTELQTAGMQVTISDATYGLVVGMLPIAQLPVVAALPQTPSVAPESAADPEVSGGFPCLR